MESKSKKQPRKRITLVLRVDLIDRVLEKAKLLQQGPNNFVNLCVEGVLDAMDAPGSYDIPILSLHNQVKGKTFLTSKAVMAIVSALVPEVYEIDAQEQKFLMELVNKHEGRLTAEVFKGYRKLAQRMNQERIAHEKELKKLQGRVESRRRGDVLCQTDQQRPGNSCSSQLPASSGKAEHRRDRCSFGFPGA